MRFKPGALVKPNIAKMNEMFGRGRTLTTGHNWRESDRFLVMKRVGSEYALANPRDPDDWGYFSASVVESAFDEVPK